MSAKPVSDLDVSLLSKALTGRRIDVVVSGSIAAVESVRFIRALRRLGASVTPWLTQGGSQFITPMALEWAAAQPVIQSFSGTASHVATGDAVVVAPASANMITRIARGMTDSPSSALIASALGQKKPVFILPAMHSSLSQAPAYLEHIQTVAAWKGVYLLQARLEEGKSKFPEPAHLADEIAHVINQPGRPVKPVLVTMGTTRGYIDDVRYLSNYSSGKLGSTISEELYRQGFKTYVVCGPCEYRPHQASVFIDCVSTGDMLHACQKAEQAGLVAGVFCASVLDFEPNNRQSGKIRSSQTELNLTLRPTEKIIGKVMMSGEPKFGFKLEIDLSPSEAKKLAESYCKKYRLSALIVNHLKNVSATNHEATFFYGDAPPLDVHSKQGVANEIVSALTKLCSDGM